MSEEFDFDPLDDPAFRADPHPTLDRLRHDCPVLRHEGRVVPVVSLFRYGDVKRVLLDHETFSMGSRPDEVARGQTGDGEAEVAFIDPPEHTRIRGAYGGSLLPGAIAEQEPFLVDHAAKLAREAVERNVIDLRNDFATPFAVSGVARLLGLPLEDVAIFTRWGRETTRNDGAVYWLRKLDPDRDARVAELTREVDDYFLGWADGLGNARQPGWFAALVLDAEAGRAPITRQEALAIGAILVLAGFETVSALICNTVRCLIENPESDAIVRTDPAQIPAAIEESLRYRAPFTHGDRRVTRPVEIGSVKLQPGDTVMSWFASANRDEEIFERSDVFDISRTPRRHFALSSGIHQCPGMSFARLEARTALEHLLKETNSIEPEGEAWLSPSEAPMIDAPEAMRVRLRGRE